MDLKILNRLCEVILNYNNKKFMDKAPILVDAHSEIGKQIISYGYAEKYFLDTFFNSIQTSNFFKDKIALDVGANIGNHSIYFSKYFKKVLSFEPVSRTFQILSLNTNFVQNIEVFNFALSDETKQSNIFVDTKASGLSSLNNTSNKTCIEKIKIKVFDNLHNIDKDLIGLVKIDVEGHEVNVLNGMKNLLKSSSPICLIEFQGSKRYEIIDLLTIFSYDKFYIVQKIGFYNKLHSRGFLLIRFVKLILGLFISPKFKIKEVSVKELLKIETEMLICSSSFSKVKLSL
jgi:FkbM family methyltransferase